MSETRTASLRRARAGAGRVTNIELFFDLVYVFAVTQLSHHLLGALTWEGAWQTLVLLGGVWLIWAYTTWVTNWLDPERLPVRLLLLALMLASLILSAALPEAFGARGLVVAGAFVVIQVGRTLFVVLALRGDVLQRNFERILVWCVASGVLWILGALWPVHAREVVWALAFAMDLLGSAVGFYTLGLGRSKTLEWTIEGNHLAERCQAFILIALGESVVVIGATFASLPTMTMAETVAFVVGFIGSAALWWLYFDRSAEAGAHRIAASLDPGRLGRSAYHTIHPIMVAGIIVVAAADDEVLAHPSVAGDAAITWLVLGGPALFLAGHALFKFVIWGGIPWSRLAAILVLALLGLLAPHISALALGICAGAVVVAVAVADRLLSHGGAADEARDAHA